MSEIKIGIGYGNIKFGITRDDLTKIAGKPNDKELYNASGEEDGFLTETWHYDDDEFSVSFDEEDNWRLTTISTSFADCDFNGLKLIGKGLDHVLALLENENLGENELEDLSDEFINQKVVNLLPSSLNLWFEDDDLSEIQWGVLWSDEDTPKWP